MPLANLGSLQIRLAETAGDIKRSQRLRYRVFYQERSAIATPWNKVTRRDTDAYDAHCDHLLVEDRTTQHQWTGAHDVVGSYRLLHGRAAKHAGGFYTESEFDLGALSSHFNMQNALELGRSCVMPSYRNKRTIELLWRGIWSYIVANRCDVLIGCASFEGTDPEKLALPLSFLHHFAAAPPAWQVRARPERAVPMDRIAKDDIDLKAAMRALPPLIKGYLRVGAFVGSGAVVDHDFGTTDVLMVLPISAIGERYIQYFGSNSERKAA
jgi:putative hemolysin